MTKNLSLQTTNGPEVLMKLVGLARRKGLVILDLNLKNEERKYTLDLSYFQEGESNFSEMIELFEDVQVATCN